MSAIRHWGIMPIPWTVAWSGEEGADYLAREDSNGVLALCQPDTPGVGKPLFASPHYQRQRRCVIEGRCDLCGKPLRNNTKVSLSDARPRVHGANVGDILQVEPLLHKECAAISLSHCPHLRRQVEAGTCIIRHVLKADVQLALLTPDAVEDLTGDRPDEPVLGHAKVWLRKWRRVGFNWLPSHSIHTAEAS